MLTTATCLALVLALVMLSANNNDGFPNGLGLLDDSETESDTDYGCDEGDEGDARYEFGDGGGWEPKKKTKSKGSPAANGGLPNYSMLWFSFRLQPTNSEGPVSGLRLGAPRTHGPRWLLTLRS